MKKNIFEELDRMKSLFTHQRGRVISEQITPNQQLAMNLGFGPVSKEYADELERTGQLKRKSFQNYAAARRKQYEKDNPVTAKASDEPTGNLAKVKDLENVTVTAKIFPLKVGRKGPKVKELQTRVGVTPDGIFGTKTDQAVAQKAKALGLQYNSQSGVDKALFDKLAGQIASQPTGAQTGTPSNLPQPPKTNVDVTPQQVQPTVTAPTGVAAAGQTPEQLFNSLVGTNAIDSLMDADGVGRRRIKYKGPEPSQEILTKVDEFLKGKGYNRIKQKVKGYGVKYVWENPSL